MPCGARAMWRCTEFFGNAQETMGQVSRRKRTHHARRDVSRAARTRARHLDYDQRHENATSSTRRQKLEAPTELDPDKAGLGMFYCVECDRHFPNNNDREAHLASKLHKRIAKKVLTEKPYTHEEAMRGAGIGIDNRRRDSQQIELDN
ncbi:hypothetical protein GLX27_001461 [Malassezia furfur]|uniref:C2H2-type domain-containing protein n=1 Tax=Malassezia furfur TaxID=55194 RepID=A0ABY8EP82_MALFU|nr:hypothetical protein GLX27_001461 [Malassezia furfur]